MTYHSVESWLENICRASDSASSVTSAKPVIQRKRKGSGADTMPSPPPSDETPQTNDVEVTPKQSSPSKRRRLDLNTDLALRQPEFAGESGEDASSQTGSTRTSTTGKKSSRLRSPVKSMLDLRLAEKPMQTIFIDALQAPPSDVATLFASSLDASRLRHIIPNCVKEQVKAAKSMVDPILDMETHFYDMKLWAGSHDTQEWDTVAEFKTLQKITVRSREAALLNLTEPAWNARIHEPLLDLALEPFDDSVSHWDVTRASINKTYLGKHKLGIDLQAKMVDFCITLGGETMKNAVWERLQTASDNHSINHSSTSPLREYPIAISIETKIPGGSTDEAKAQLSVWVTSHLKRLRTLSGTSVNHNTVGITLPVVEVNGSEWSLLFLRDTDQRIQLIQTTKIGDTKTLVGCYQVLSFLRHLGFWTISVYRPWFIANALAG